MTSNASWVKPFVAGVVATMAASHILPKLKKTNPNKAKEPEAQTETKTTTYVMDSPTLDNRILRKAEAALRLRTSRLIIVVERCTNDHNYSAILRTAEALGVQHVYIIAPQALNATLRIGGKVDETEESVGEDEEYVEDDEDSKVNVSDKVKLHRSNGQAVKRYDEADVQDRANHHLFAQKALEWLEVTEFKTTKECVDKLRNDGYKIWSTDLSQVAVTLDEEGLRDETCGENIIPDKLAIVFGTEAVGCSTEILDASDKRVYLPLRGFADSLNLSVATALVVHHLFILDPTLVGAMPKEELIELRRTWYSKLATQRILTKSEKVKRKKLSGLIKRYEEIEHREKHPESNPFPLRPEQKDKLAILPGLREELKQLEDEVYAKALGAVEDLVHNPPDPLGDMRRHDNHRVTFSGKGTKKNAGEAWANMPATTYLRNEADTASFFRDRVKDTTTEM